MVKPIVFPGGSIGDLAVNGTVNDLAVAGARPLALSLSLILEEGLAAEDLRRRWRRSPLAASAAGVQIIAGDTKVVERGHADGMYICTTGVGRRDPRAALSPRRAAARGSRAGLRLDRRARDGDHARARGSSGWSPTIESDTRSLWPAADALLEAAGPSLRRMRERDTRAASPRCSTARARVGRGDDGARGRRTGDTRPWRGRRGPPRDRPDVRRQRGQVRRVRGPRGGGRGAGRAALGAGCEDAAEIGEVRTEPPGMVLVETSFGGKRVMDQLVGDPLPRIC